jgi:hypothetical protein
MIDVDKENTNLELKKINFKFTESAANNDSVKKFLQPERTFNEANIIPKEGDTYELSLERNNK